jgi:V-type H+-transporting ATPase subunit a
LFIH